MTLLFSPLYNSCFCLQCQVDYKYDNLFRLTEEKITDAVNGNRTVGYLMDAVGNRLSKTDSVGGTTTYNYDNNDRLLTETTNGQTKTYIYDQKGNTISESKAANDKTDYTWDDKGRLIRAVITTPTGTKTAEYQYNENNIRTSQKVDGVETKFLLDSNRDYAQVLEEYNPNNGNVIASYVYGLDLISQSRNGVTSFYLYDGLGSVRGLTDRGGIVSDRYNYDAYGNLLSTSGSSANNYRFTGEQFDPNTGDYYLRDRYYGTDIGRFTRADRWQGVLTNPVSLHRYIYANNNPVTNIDPSGKFSITEVLATSSLIGGIIGGIGGTYYGAYRSGEILSTDTLKFALIGVVGGAAAGAFIGGSIALSPAGLPNILSTGVRQLFRKLNDTHTTTSYATVAGFTLGFAGGLLEPDYEVVISSAIATANTLAADALIRGAIWRRQAITATVASDFIRSSRPILIKYGQATTFTLLPFAFGFTVGYASGSSLRNAWESLYG